MSLEHKRFTEGMLGANTYLIYDTESREAAVVDTGNRVAGCFEFTRENNIRVKYIILTHGHYDHVCHIEEYFDVYAAPLCCTEEENRNLGNIRLNCSDIFDDPQEYRKADKILKDGDVLMLGREELKIIKTPGHTSGGICILAGKYIFTGDVLFYNTIGRTDLGDGNETDLLGSLKMLSEMDPDLIILPGHGTRSTIGREKQENPFLEF